MIELYDIYLHCRVHVRADAIKTVLRQSNHHGARCVVVTDDGKSYSVQTDPDLILAQIAKALQPAKGEPA